MELKKAMHVRRETKTLTTVVTICKLGGPSSTSFLGKAIILLYDTLRGSVAGTRDFDASGGHPHGENLQAIFMKLGV